MLEELGLVLEPGQLLNVDHSPKVQGKTEVIHVTYDGGIVQEDHLKTIVLHRRARCVVNAVPVAKRFGAVEPLVTALEGHASAGSFYQSGHEGLDAVLADRSHVEHGISSHGLPTRQWTDQLWARRLARAKPLGGLQVGAEASDAVTPEEARRQSDRDRCNLFAVCLTGLGLIAATRESTRPPTCSSHATAPARSSDGSSVTLTKYPHMWVFCRGLRGLRLWA